ncbi:MAG: hypothetical protein ACRCY4_02450 [Brevinema sp.]
MKEREFQNALTGLASFGLWAWLSYRTPEYSVQIALGSLLALLGFAGRDTIIEILKSWRGNG